MRFEKQNDRRVFFLWTSINLFSISVLFLFLWWIQGHYTILNPLIKALYLFYGKQASTLELDPFVLRKLGHLFAYFSYSFILFFMLRSFTKAPYLWTLQLALFTGIGDELVQFYLPNRYSLVQDILVDGIGILLALSMIKIGALQRRAFTNKEKYLPKYRYNRLHRL